MSEREKLYRGICDIRGPFMSRKGAVGRNDLAGVAQTGRWSPLENERGEICGIQNWDEGQLFSCPCNGIVIFVREMSQWLRLLLMRDRLFVT